MEVIEIQFSLSLYIYIMGLTRVPPYHPLNYNYYFFKGVGNLK